MCSIILHARARKEHSARPRWTSTACCWALASPPVTGSGCVIALDRQCERLQFSESSHVESSSWYARASKLGDNRRH